MGVESKAKGRTRLKAGRKQCDAESEPWDKVRSLDSKLYSFFLPNRQNLRVKDGS